MSDDYDKSEAPSPYKLEEARKKGQVRKSTDLVIWVTSVVALALAVLMAARVAADFSYYTTRMLRLYDALLTPQAFYRLSQDASWFAFGAIVPLLLLLLLFSIAIQVFQTGFVWTGAQLKMDFSRINPVAGFKKMIARKVWFDLAKNTLKLTLVGLVFYWVMPVLVDDALRLSLVSPQLLREGWVKLMLQVCGLLLLLLLPFALFDFGFSHHDFMRKMRMSKKEVKDEYKKREGDPHVKSKQRQVQQDLLKRSASLSQVPQANLVVVNPTHIAVAMLFDKNTMLAPKVLSLGKGELAGQIRTIARQHRIPIVQHKTLARQLYRESRIGGFVPVSCFKLLVPVYRWVLEWQEREES